MKLSVDLIPQFTHKAPEGCSYEVEEFKSGVFAIWLRYNREFDYNLGKSVCSIWGFYSYKKCEFYSPVNSKTIGKVVNFEDTRPWTSMPIKYQGVEHFFV